MNFAFKKCIFVSFIGHLTLFSIFSFSFGGNFIKPNCTEISFFGSVLNKSDVIPSVSLRSLVAGGRSNLNSKIASSLSLLAMTSMIPKASFESDSKGEKVKGEGDLSEESNKFIPIGFIKPKLNFPPPPNADAPSAQKAGLTSEEKNFINKSPDILTGVKNKPAIMFYPHLPFYFNIYFNDRQTVHIEVMFNINSTLKTNSISLKRKISSGNLEVDLLVMRYLSHYLFIQQNKFSSNDWQTVKIDFSPK